MFRYFAVAVLTLVFSTLCLASSSYVVPTTTLAAQLSNNTSAAPGFASQSNGNLGGRNVSKVDVHTLLYSGATTKVYAHMVLWFGDSGHMNIGYSSTDPNQVKNQIDDMVSRGIDGVILDWYGPNNPEDQAAQLILAEAEKHPGFSIAIMVDQGAINRASCAGCSPQQSFISELQYIEHTYFGSPAYMTIGGKPVVTNFNVGLSYPSIDWRASADALSARPVFLFQNNDGFSQTMSDGSYAWVMPTTNDYGKQYLSSFYDAGKAFPSEQTIGAVYKGFNDTKASWGSNRIMKQQCGETWLQTFDEVNGLYNSGKQLPLLQLVTWNDYEEATEIESGIDNCFALYPAMNGNTLQWTISGDESTVDHYIVYISSDGQNLMPLTETAAGLRSVNLCSFPIPGGNYKLFAQAVGKPSLTNQMTDAVSYSPTCPAATQPPAPPSNISFSASPADLTLISGKSGTLTIAAKAQSGVSNSAISLSCASLPSTLNCSFSPASITPGSGTAVSTLTISAVAVAGLHLPQQKKSIPIFASWLLSLGIVGFAFIGHPQGRRKLQLFAVIAVLGAGMMSTACGGSAGQKTATVATSPGTTTPQSYPVTIQGTSSAGQFSATVNVTVE